MKKIKFILLLIPIFLCSGCYNYRELNELAITSAIGIDKTDNGYLATIQVMNTQKNGSDSNSSTDQPKFVVYSAEDKNLQEAFRKIILDSSKRIYANHIQILVIGSDLAEEGIYDVLDLFFRNSESRKQFSVLIAKDCKAKDVLNIVTPLETLNSKNINDGLMVESKYLGVGEVVTYEQLVGNYLDSHKEIVLPSVEIVNSTIEGDNLENIASSSPDSRVVASTTALFKDDKLLGFLDDQESIALSFVRNKISNTVLSYECSSDKYVVGEVIDSKTSLSMYQDPLTAKIKIKSSLNLNEVTCDLDLEDPDVIDEIEDNLANELKSQIYNTLDKIIIDFNTDVLGFRDNLYKNNPNYYEKIKDEWYDLYFSNLNIEIEVDFKFVEKGNALKVIKR